MPIESLSMTSYIPLKIVRFNQSLTTCKIFANQTKCQKFDLDTKVKVKWEEKHNLLHLTGRVRLYFGECL